MLFVRAVNPSGLSILDVLSACQCCISMLYDQVLLIHTVYPCFLSKVHVSVSTLHVHAAHPLLRLHEVCQCCMSLLFVHATCLFCMSMLHALASCPCIHAACLRCMSALHVQCPYFLSRLHVHAVCPCCMPFLTMSPRCMSTLHVHTACPCCMNMLPGHAA
jgi:hypothetical protein